MVLLYDTVTEVVYATSKHILGALGTIASRT